MGRKKIGTVGIYRNVMPHHVDKIDRYIKYLKDEDRKQKGDLYDGMTINHIDGDITNNHIDNLEQITQSENIHNTYAKNKWSKLLKKYGNIHFISVYR